MEHPEPRRNLLIRGTPAVVQGSRAGWGEAEGPQEFRCYLGVTSDIHYVFGGKWILKDVLGRPLVQPQ